MEATLTWMALMARKDKGCKAVRREVAAAGDPFEAWRQWEERHLTEARIAGIKAKNAAGLPKGYGKVWSELHSDRATMWRMLHRSLRLAETELNRQFFTLESQGWIRRLPGRA